MKIFVIDFSDTHELTDKLESGNEIAEEKEDGARAYKRIGELLPDKIFINYKVKPGHGRQTALSIRARKKTSGIPVFFVGGDEAENKKVADIGKCITLKELGIHV